MTIKSQSQILGDGDLNVSYDEYVDKNDHKRY